MEKILSLKEQGNTSFKNAKFIDAITFYEEALALIKFRLHDIKTEKLTAEERQKAE